MSGFPSRYRSRKKARASNKREILSGTHARCMFLLGQSCHKNETDFVCRKKSVLDHKGDYVAFLKARSYTRWPGLKTKCEQLSFDMQDFGVKVFFLGNGMRDTY